MKTAIIILAAILFVVVINKIIKDHPEKELFKQLSLFPRWVKYLGVFWFIISLIIHYYLEFNIKQENFAALHSMSFGIFLICFSRDKIEDEMTNVVRLKSFCRSVILVYVTVTIYYMVHYLMGYPDFSTPASQILLFIFIIYLANFNIAKSKLRSEK